MRNTVNKMAGSMLIFVYNTENHNRISLPQQLHSKPFQLLKKSLLCSHHIYLHYFFTPSCRQIISNCFSVGRLIPYGIPSNIFNSISITTHFFYQQHVRAIQQLRRLIYQCPIILHRL